MKRFLTFLFIIVLMIPGAGVRAQDKTAPFQKLEDMLQWAYVHNPSLQAARAGLKAAEEKLPQAHAGWKPKVSARGNVTDSKIDGSNFGGDGTTSKEIEASFTQPLYRGGRTTAAIGSAEAFIAARRALLEGIEQALLLDAARAYMDVVRDMALLDLGKSNREVIARQLEATRNRFEVGELTKTDVSQAQARLAEAEAQIIRAAGDLQESQAAYERIIGAVPGTPGMPRLDFPIPETLDNALDFAERNNPDVRAAAYLHKSAVKDADAVFGAQLPELALFGTWNRQYDPQPGVLEKSTNRSVGIDATVPIYSGGLASSRLRESRQIANQRYMEILDSRRRVRQQTVAQWGNLRAASAEIAARQAQAEAAALAQEGVRQEAEVGNRTIIDALDADREHLDAQVALITARRDEVVATFELAATLGLLTPEILGFPVIEGELAIKSGD